MSKSKSKSKKIEYTEIARAKVISSCSKGGFTVAQRLDTEEDGRVTTVYLKGAFHVNDVQGLYNLRDAVNMAIKKTEEGLTDNADWDEV